MSETSLPAAASANSPQMFLQVFEIGEVVGGGHFSRVLSGRHVAAVGSKKAATPPTQAEDDVAIKLISKADLSVLDHHGSNAQRQHLSLRAALGGLDDDSIATCQPSTSTRLKRVRTEYHILLEQLRERHPFLVEVLHLGHTTDYLFYAMRLYRRGTLAQLLRGPAGAPHARKITLSEEQARFVVCEVMIALEFLHYRGIVYRDLKPENILLTDQYHVVLSDFDLCHCPAAHDDDLANAEVEAQLAESRAQTMRRVQKMSTATAAVAPSASRSDALSSNGSTVSNAQDAKSDASSATPTKSPHKSLGGYSSVTPTQGSSPSKLGRSAGTTSPPPPASVSHQRTTSFVGTLEYISPDVIQDQPVAPGIDLWSLGMLLYELLFGFALFRGNDDRDVLFKIKEYAARGKDARLTFPMSPTISDDAADLLSKLLCPLRQQRLDLEGVRRHPWVGKFMTAQRLRALHREHSPLSTVEAVSRSARPVGKHGAFEKYFHKLPSKRPGEHKEIRPAVVSCGLQAHAAELPKEILLKSLESQVMCSEGASAPGLSFFLPVQHHIAVGAKSDAELRQLFAAEGNASCSFLGAAREESLGETLPTHSPSPKESWWSRLLAIV